MSNSKAPTIRFTPFNDATIGSLLSVLFLVIAVVLFASFSFRLYQPTLNALATKGWWSFVYRPSLIWLAMGMSLLAIEPCSGSATARARRPVTRTPPG